MDYMLLASDSRNTYLVYIGVQFLSVDLLILLIDELHVMSFGGLICEPKFDFKLGVNPVFI